MNRIFKVIWSKTKHCYVVVSEYAKANTKAAHTGVRVTAAALAVAAVLLAPVDYSTAWADPAPAATQEVTVKDTSNAEQTVYTKDGTDTAIEQKMADEKTDKALHVTKDGKLIVGTDEKQQVKDIAIRGALKSSSVSTGNITATGDITVKDGKVEANGVYDDTTQTGNYTKQNVTVGKNLSTLDTQVKANADAVKIAADKTAGLSYDEKTKTTTVNDKLAAGSAQITKSIAVGNNANIGGAVNAGSLNSRGNLNVDGNALVKGTLTSQSTINGKEIVSQTNITAKNKVVGMQGVVDNTLTSGTYVTAGNTVGQNINALDEQVKTNAETANQLQHSLTAEAATREAGDNAINNKLAADKTDTALHVSKSGNLIVGTNENQTVKDVKIRGQLASGSVSTGNITSTGDVSVTGKVEAGAVYDDTTKNGAYTKQANTVGANLNALDQGIQQEAAAREAADNDLKTQIAAKANVADVYTKTEADDTFAAKAALNQESIDRTEADTALQKAIDTEARQRKYSVTNLENADKQLQANIDAEAAARDTADKALDSRTTALEDKTEAITYDKDTNTMQIDTRLTAAQGVYDSTTKEKGNYIEADKTVGENLNSLDTQVKTNADAVAAEETARKAADTALDNRITEVKNYLQQDAAATYVSKDDASVQDGAVVKAANKVGQNVQDLDTALAKETAARIGADKAQDKVIAQVNQNMADGFNTINTNMANGFNALNAADAAEKKARVEADTKLAEAVNNGLSLNDENVLQKNETKIAADGTVTTSKTDANEMILNKGKENQITLNEKGIKVGTNSTVIDKDGVYTGGDTYSEAKAALKSDGSIKGADGKFTVNSANGTVNVNNQIELNGATGNVKANSLNIGDGNFKVNSNGGVTAAGGKTTLASDGSVKAADGKFTVNSNGGVKAADGKITLSSDGSVKVADGKFTVNTNGGVKAADGKITLASDGSVKAADGKFTVDTNGAVKAANGNTTIDSNGNIKTAGTLSAADGSFKVDNTGKITSTGLDAGNGTIQTTGTIKAGDVQTGTLETTGDATIGGDLTVKGKLNVDEIDMTKNGIVGDNNVTASTKVTAGEITGYKKATSTKDSSEKESAFDYDENGTSTWAKATDADGNWNKSTMSVEGSGVTSKAIDSEKNSNLSTQTATQSQSTLTDVNKNTNTATQSATESSSILANKEGLSSTFKQNVSEILNQINKSDTEYAKVDQKVDNITSEVKNGDNSTSTTQTATDIANTAENGTISNNAKNLTNTASENITNTSTNGNISNIAANGTINNEAKNISNKAAEALANDAKTITNTASESVTTQIGDGSAVKSVMNENGIANTAAGKAITNDAADITNTGTNSVTNQVGTNKVLVNNDKVETAYGDDTYTTWDASGIVNSTTGNMSTTVGGDQTNDIKGSQTNTIGGSQTTNVTSDSSLTAENINNTAKNKITNKALDVETDAASSIVNKVSNDYGTNTSTQTSSQTQEEMSQEDGKTASYLRGAGEAKSQLTNGDTKTTIDTIAGQTNTNITDGTNTSNNLQKADQAASSVTDGTNTTVVNQNAKSLASSITDGTKANNTSNTVDQSVQVIKASDTKFSSSTKTAGAFNDTLVSGDSIVNILKDADNGSVQSNVSKGDNSTSVKQTVTDITNTAKNGTIANDAQNISNSATEKLSNSAAEIENTATKSITSKVGDNVSSTMGTDSIVTKVGTTTVTTTDGKTKLTNEAGTHETEMDYATVLKDLGVHGNATIDQNLTVKGDSDLQGNATVGKNLTVNGTSDLKGDVTMEANATVKKDLTVEGTTTTNKLVVENGATVTGGTTTDTLHVTSTSTFDGAATFKDVVTMEKDLTVGGNAAVTGSVTASSYKVGDNTYIDADGINANNQKVTNVAAGDLSAASTDAVNGSQLYSTNQRVSTVENRVDGVENRVTNVENRVDKMDSRIDKVGANAAAMANLHPLEFDGDSKWNVAAAVGNYKGETAAAVGAFYRPNEDVMFNLSTTFGNDENMVGGGVSLRLGKGGNHEKDKKLKAALAENNDLRSKVDNLTARMDALLSVLNPSMSKDFPDVPANHWAYEAVSRLAGNDIVQGYANGKFHGERTMTRYEMAEIIYNALSKGAKAEKKLVEEFKPELQAMAAQKQAK